MRIASILSAFILIGMFVTSSAGVTPAAVEEAIDETVREQVVEEVSALLVQ